MRINNLWQSLGPAILFLAALALGTDLYLFSTSAPLAACMRVSMLFGVISVVVIVAVLGKSVTQTTAVNSSSRLGQLLLMAGLINEDELNDALRDHRKLRLPLGAMLVQTGAISPRELCRALETQSEIRSGAATVELATSKLSR